MECSAQFDCFFHFLCVFLFNFKYQKVKNDQIINLIPVKSRMLQLCTAKWTGSWKAKRNQNTRHQVNFQKYSGRRQKSLRSTRRSQLHSQRAVNSNEEDGTKGESILFQWIWAVDKCGASLMKWERQSEATEKHGGERKSSWSSVWMTL